MLDWRLADGVFMYINPTNFLFVIVALAGILLTLYIMRRRVRLGRRTPKF